MSPWLELAVRAARAGGQHLLEHLGQLQDVRVKSASGDLVTEADLASEKAILEVLRREVPEHGILAEESGAHNANQSEYLWAIDPLDGTLNYAHAFPFFCVSIGLLKHNTPILGVIYAPALNELFQAEVGQGATRNGQPLQVSAVNTLEQSFLATGFPYTRGQIEDNNYKEFMYFGNRCQDIRRPGSAALDLANVACGRFDGYWERHLNPWDLVAGAAIILAAGGQISSYSGEVFDPHSGEIVASNGALHAQLIEGLQEVRTGAST